MVRAMRFTLFWMGFSALFMPLVSLAQEPPVKDVRLALSECVDIALKNNSQIVQGRYNVAVADAQVDNARRAFLPSLSSSYGLSRSVSGPREGSYIDPATNLLVTSLGESRTSRSQSAGASLGMSLYDPGDWATLAANKKGVKKSEMDLANSRQQIIFQVKQRYFQLLQAMKLLELQQEQVQVTEQTLKRAETLYEIGSAPLSNMLSARSNLENVRATLILRENNVEIARSNLGFTLGMEMDVRIVPSEETFEVAPLPFTYEEARGRALEGHPSLLSQKFSMLQARDNLRATQVALRHPTVSMSSGYSWSLSGDEKFRGMEDLFMKNYGYSFRLSASFPIFNGLSTENSVKIQKLQYLRSMEQLEQAKRQASLDIKQSFLNLGRYRRSITAYEAAVRAAEEDFKLQDERYNFGAGTFLERQQAQLDLFSARNQLVQAAYNYQIELARLEQAVGISDVKIDEE